jgi:GTP-binding protein Era
MTTLANNFRTGYVAIVGEPNVGKSTLLNAFLNQKLSIVTSKPQTTRQRVLGILTTDGAQIIFLDTPGLIQPRYLLHERMVRAAEAALDDADVILVLTEVSRGTTLPPEVAERVMAHRQDKPTVLVINKVDTIHRAEVLPLIEAFAGTKRFAEIVPVSALKRENVDHLLEVLIRYLPTHPPLYPADMVSEQPERFFVAELIREQIVQQFRDEIPYSTAVNIVEFKERDDGKTYIHAEIIAERDSQKGILIGTKGAALKKVGELARKQIEEFLGRPVFLKLYVKVREGWRENERQLRQLGYVVE